MRGSGLLRRSPEGEAGGCADPHGIPHELDRAGGHGYTHDVSDESFESGAIVGGNGGPGVDVETGMPP